MRSTQPNHIRITMPNIEEDKRSAETTERLSECMRESMNVVHESRQLFEEHHEAVSERHSEVSQFRTRQHIEAHSLWMRDKFEIVTAETRADIQ